MYWTWDSKKNSMCKGSSSSLHQDRGRPHAWMGGSEDRTAATTLSEEEENHIHVLTSLDGGYIHQEEGISIKKK